jgi:uncharacterized protein
VKLTLETADVNLISAWESGAIRVGEEWLREHVILSAQDIVLGWGVSSPESLSASDLKPAIDLKPEIILLGTGNRLALPDIDLMSDLASVGIGLEIMDTPAACRTYNVLVHEDREVVAALFLG